jgi:PAS domain S-box-containing protein
LREICANLKRSHLKESILSNVSAVAKNLLANLGERFLVFIESVPDAMVLSDRSGRIVLVNRNISSLFGYSSDELVGRMVEVLMPARFRSHHRKDRADYCFDPRIRPMGQGRELSGLRKDGSEFRVEISLSPVEIGGKTLVWSAIRDVTEREAAVSRLRIALKEQGLRGGLISICAWCKRIHDEAGSWLPVEQYLAAHLDTKITHGLCKDCLRNLDPTLHAHPTGP